MYFRKGRFSIFLGNDICWLRIRDKNMMPGGFLLRIGKEIT